MQINAAVVRDKGGPFLIEALELDDPVNDEIRVRMVASGICHTDLMISNQAYPMPLPAVLGHEGAGVVEAVGPAVTTIRPGDHVLLSFAACGACPSCAAGQASYCWHHMEMNFSGRRYSGSNWDVPSPIRQPSSLPAGGFACEPISGAFFHQSSFASQAIATEANAVVVDRDLPLDILAPLGCGLQTGAGAVLNTLRPEPGSSIAVTGAGAVGLAAIMAAAVAGCAVIVAVDINRERLALAREVGATHTLDPRDGDLVARVRGLVDGGVRYTLETTANPAIFRAAVDMLQVRGVCGLIGGAKLGIEVAFDMTHILFGRTIRGILQGDSVPKQFIPELIALYRGGRFPIDRLIRHYPLSRINEAVADMKSGMTIKPVLLMEP
ncbi:NAD(P)-dependent alcohol dehydrogenase [Bradyrhizobium sp. U87765 SZCCT0131]|uniref:NAD(P)-dependent alcohol dehydrogenase n=1 Tax=unclassified Bradyrhizobium TaxID=2631580 RepID=UPI001BA4D967|nr:MULTISPECIES: NAD(P)-dependent alcohol dehydrogenase [unclassified Bradyrhizobium]MBR1221568.1 NAD(P)-dependent alcohol dehydrogenase [Bradyrhizobium sp. U87765 SZCCT0131]MBR1264509.1 NAD(P)-dependent alcohol dehydrogenase [Bradyrhizobium sp. U87765 SZCCT0134]MBR1304584.1 NAD(P)-dependent alcohol dehydrogenase [Bradyrhizobium sp. U87765 SZCCT0110]MBR1322559.1 NAD(P)-dependent alcohol dehydrogenase [Bradyrhizobium sp. U87765 SZCCT0109]MBR1346513.1 NAD(P)-dependent alcohol dehydrogenase [Brad